MLGESVGAPVSIPAVFAAAGGARSAGVVALRCGQRSWTYRELDEASNRLARVLIDRGVCSGQRVALLLPRTAEAVVAILAVVKTGAAYVPIDPSVPVSRMEFVLGDAGPVAVITTAGLADRLAGRDVSIVLIDDPRD